MGMAGKKLSPLASAAKISTWVNLASRFSSIPCKVDMENSAEIDKASDLEAKLKFLRNKLVPDNLIRVLDNTSDVESAAKVFEWASVQKRFYHTADTYSRMIFKLGMAGKTQELDELCQNMIRDRCIGAKDAFLSLVTQLVKEGKLDEAIRVLKNMSAGGYEAPIALFNIVLGALVEVKRELKDVMFVYKEMVKARQLPTVETLNYLLEALFEAGLVESALDQYKRMNKKGCTPTSRTFLIIIKNLIAKSRLNEALVVLREMRELRTKLDLKFYTCVIPLLLRENKLKEGMDLFEKMRASKFPPEPLIYNCVIHHLCNNLLLCDANNIIESMIDCGVAPSDGAFEAMVNGFCVLGKIDEAINFLGDKQVSATSAHNKLLEGCCIAGEVLLAKHLLEKMSHRNIADCNSWNILLRWLCERSRLREAFLILGRMLVVGSPLNSSTLSALVLGYCKLRKYENLMEIFNLLRAKCWVLDSLSYSELIECLCHKDHIAEATEVFSYMAGSGLPLESSSFVSLIKGICDARGVDEAIKVRSLAVKCGTVCTNDAYTIILHKMAEKYKPKYLLAVYSLMLVVGCTIGTEVYCILIRAISSQSLMKDAALLFNLMVSEGLLPSQEVLCELLSCFANRSQLQVISSSICTLILKYESFDSDTCCLLINGLWKEGNRGKALHLLDLMLEKGWVPDARVHALLTGLKARKEVDGRKPVQDGVGDILSENFGDG